MHDLSNSAPGVTDALEFHDEPEMKVKVDTLA
jgi:hypothetical protein